MAEERITEAQFSMQCAFIAKIAAAWAGDLLTLPERYNCEADTNTVARFTDEMRGRLARLDEWVGRDGQSVAYPATHAHTVRKAALREEDRGNADLAEELGAAMRFIEEAALTATVANQAVEVKALEWVEIDLRAAAPPLVVWEAKTPFMTYTLESILDRPWFCYFICAHFSDLDEAKAAVQADYEHRIRSALTATRRGSATGQKGATE